MSDYRLSDALDEIEDIAYELGKTHESSNENRGQQRARILDIRAAIFEALSLLDREVQLEAGITHPSPDENAINPCVVVSPPSIVSNGEKSL